MNLLENVNLLKITDDELYKKVTITLRPDLKIKGDELAKKYNLKFSTFVGKLIETMYSQEKDRE